MENASKALIIAGAILLSILLISLGIMIFSQAQSAIDGSGMSDAQITAFNARFLKYEGRQKGSVIRSMVQEVMANNYNDEASDETRVGINLSSVTINGQTVSSDSSKINQSLITLNVTNNAQPIYGTLVNSKTYTVSFTYHNSRIAIIQVK